MGIQGLLPLLKTVQKPCNLKDMKSLTIGVDAYVWLHKGAISCAIELATRQPTSKYLKYSLNCIRMLKHFGITPYLVFDGDYLPSKATTEAQRARHREESKKKGLELLALGRTTQAYHELQKAIDITPYMARELIEELKHLEIQYIVAPYEADAQLVYLERSELIDGILSEDSDLLVFGAKRLFTKLDQHGNCIEINRRDFSQCKAVSLVGWTDTDFRRMAILSGCDYLANINKLGLKSAYRLVRQHKTPEKILNMMAFDGQYHIPPDYLENFKKAEQTFLYQRVYCPKAEQLVTCTTLPPDRADDADKTMPFIGANLEPEVAKGIATGDLDPMTKKPIILANKENAKKARHQQFEQSNRRTTIGTVSDLKPSKKPINHYFKRVPLTELNPNNFSPSPSQHRLLVEASATTWFSSPAAEAAYEASLKTPTNRRTTSWSYSEQRDSQRLIQSSKPPNKRLRLSGEKHQEESSEKPVSTREVTKNDVKDGEITSPFFKNARKSKRVSRNLWSDSSVQKPKSDSPDIPAESAKPNVEVSQGSSEKEEPQSTRENSKDSSNDDDDSNAAETAVKSPLPEFDESTDPTVIESVPESPVKSRTSEQSMADKIAQYRYIAGSSPIRKSTADVMPKPVEARAPAASDADVPRCRSPKRPRESTGSCDNVVVVASFGSEDHLVPASDDEHDDEHDDASQSSGSPRKHLDLSKFAYSSSV